MSLDQFHFLDKKGEASGVFDNAIFEYLKKNEHLKVIGGTVYHYNAGVYKEDGSGAWLKSKIRACIYPQFIKSQTLQRVYNLFLMDDALQADMADMNQFPVHWICFRNGMYDVINKKMYAHKPEFLALNMIPHDFNPAVQPKCDTVDEWLDFISSGKSDNREMLLQFAGLCMTRDTTIQKFLMLDGSGGNGKGVLLQLIIDMVGEDNVSTVPLERLQERFTTIQLAGRLLNACGDLRIEALDDVSVLKQLTGEDFLYGEKKGHDGVRFKPYAHLLFSVNGIPLVRGERTGAFYRRLLILPMNNRPDKPDTHLIDRLRVELDGFIHLCVDALGRLYKQGYITESADSEEAVRRLREDSDSVSQFFNECISADSKARVRRVDLYDAYTACCERSERQALSRTMFYRALRSRGISEIGIEGARYFVGISLEKTATDGGWKSTNDLEQLPFK